MMARSSSLKNKFLSLLLSVARWRFVRPIVTFSYQHMNRYLPLDRVCENAHWVAFHHPQPEYPLHFLILPKQVISSLPGAPHNDPNLYADLILLMQALIRQFELETQAYRLITNGGQNQTIPIWHWHLVCEASGKGCDYPGVNHD